MKRDREFKISAAQRAGILRAAKWHKRYAKLLREAIADRTSHGFNIYGELLWRAEEHESSAAHLRELARG